MAAEVSPWGFFIILKKIFIIMLTSKSRLLSNGILFFEIEK